MSSTQESAWNLCTAQQVQSIFEHFVLESRNSFPDTQYPPLNTCCILSQNSYYHRHQYYLSSHADLPSLYLSHVWHSVVSAYYDTNWLSIEIGIQLEAVSNNKVTVLRTTGLVWQKSSVCRNISIIESISTKEDTSE